MYDFENQLQCCFCPFLEERLSLLNTIISRSGAIMSLPISIKIGPFLDDTALNISNVYLN